MKHQEYEVTIMHVFSEQSDRQHRCAAGGHCMRLTLSNINRYVRLAYRIQVKLWATIWTVVLMR